MDKEETVQVTAAPGQMEQVAKALIRLADHPHDVVWASRGAHFVVPESVAVKYAAEQAGELAAAAEADTSKPAAKPRSRRRAAAAKETPAAGEKPATGRRGRASRRKKEGDGS